MTARDIRIASAAFLALTVSVGVNLFALQDKDRGSAIETSAIGFTTPPPLPGPRSWTGTVAWHAGHASCATCVRAGDGRCGAIRQFG